ncbi:MAG TPA: TonB family protein, partial [Candidatus Aminicenantes bacterium]|nr:TonB family protein [Candidatus Aminicenantes bacterium]
RDPARVVAVMVGDPGTLHLPGHARVLKGRTPPGGERPAQACRRRPRLSPAAGATGGASTLPTIPSTEAGSDEDPAPQTGDGRAAGSPGAAPDAAGPGPGLPRTFFPSPLPGRFGDALATGPTPVELAVRQGERQADLLRRWADRVLARLEPRWVLPLESRGGMFGTVELTATFTAGGTLLKATVARSSGHPPLDRAAMAAMVPGTVFEPPPCGGSLSQPVEVTLVFHYQT